MVPGETSWFHFSSSPNVNSHEFVSEHQDSRENKTNCFLRDHAYIVKVYNVTSSLILLPVVIPIFIPVLNAITGFQGAV